MALLNQMSKLVVVLVLIVALFVFILGVMVGLQFQVLTLNTNTATANLYGFESGGQNGGEILDASMYVTSWSPNLDSETIVIAGTVNRHFGSLACLVEYRYRVYTTSNGLSWNELSTSPYVFAPPQSFNAGGVTPLSVKTLKLRGLYEGGLKSDLEFHIKDVAGPGCTLGFDKGWLWAGTDQAYLKSGVGSVRAPAQAQVGDSISVCVDIPYVASALSPGKGWLLYGFSSAQNKEILRVDPVLVAGTSCYPYTVASGDFVQSAACTTENRLEWHLFNELWAKDFAFTTTIDQSKFAPSFTFTSVSGDREVGSQVTLSFNATPNPTTKYPILRIVIAYGYGAPDNEVTLSPGASSYQITPGQGGLVHVEGYAVDTSCRPSPAARLDIQIRERGQGGASVPTPNLLLFLLPIISLTVVGLVVAAYVDAPWSVRILVFVVFLIAGILVAVVLVPEILFPGG